MDSTKNRWLFAGVFLTLAWCGRDGARAGSVGSSPFVTPSLEVNAGIERTGTFVETRLNTSNVATITQKGTYTTDGRIIAQPLYVQGVVFSGIPYDLVIVATMGNSIYAFDANNPGSSALWRRNLGPALTGYPFYSTNKFLYGEALGCLSTPVIDKTLGQLFAVCSSAAANWILYRIDLATGSIQAQATLGGSVMGTGDPTGGDMVSGGVLTFYPAFEFQRSGLALLSGNVYIAFASYGDSHPWHGWVMAYKESDLSQQSIWCAAPNGYGGSIWMLGGAPVVANGSIYVTTGNGDYNGTANYSDSIVRLSTTLSVIDWFTPANQATLESMDLDIASSRAIFMQQSQQIVSAGKDNQLYVIDATCMGHLQGSGGSCVAPQVFSVDATLPITSSDGLYATGSLGTTYYTQANNGAIYRLTETNRVFNQTPIKVTGPWTFRDIFSLSSDGIGDGLLWAVTVSTNAYSTPQQGTLRVFNARTLAPLYSDASIGQMNKFGGVLVANGRAYIPSGSAVYVYGL